METLLSFDLNCDVGEGIGNEQQLMPYITAANIACGFHAGDADTMRQVVDLCLEHGVAIGAHPSYPDREHFGRRDLLGTAVQLQDLKGLVAEQLHILQRIARERGAALRHVKPHGALYNRAARDREVGQAICSAIREVDAGLLLYGLSGSPLQAVAAASGLQYVHEAFADRTYQDDGSLTPRTEPGALIEEEAAALRQVLELVQHKTVTTVTGKKIALAAQTICIHGDGPHAVAFARALRRRLAEA